MPTKVETLARFVGSARCEDLSAQALEQLKLRVLDSLGVAIGALDAAPMRALRAHVDELGGRALSSLIGGGATAPDRAAFYNGALVRYLDFMDSYLAPGETFHPSDNLGAVLACAEYADASGRRLLAALAVAYEVQARLSEAAPVRAKGFDHTTQGAYAAAAGAAKALGLSEAQTANALAMSGTANNALRVTRTGALSHWKGLAYPNTASSAVQCALLAKRGLTGPLEVFEGNKGFEQVIAGAFDVDWSDRSLEGVRRSILKRYDAEIHAQSAVEACLELRRAHRLDWRQLAAVELSTFQVAYDIIGGGEEGAKTEVKTKEQADHSLPYMVAVALIDGELLPAQYRPERIAADDVQGLLRRVRVRPNAALSARFPAEVPVQVGLRLKDGRVLSAAKSDYEGFHTRPMSRERVVEKFHAVAGRAGAGAREAVVSAVERLPAVTARQLGQILAHLEEGALSAR